MIKVAYLKRKDVLSDMQFTVDKYITSNSGPINAISKELSKTDYISTEYVMEKIRIIRALMDNMESALNMMEYDSAKNEDKSNQ